MQIKLFTIPINSVEDYNDELNLFLQTNKIVEIEKQLIQSGTNYFWCLYITYTKGDTKPYSSKKKIDYKELLLPPVFKIFSKLREIRKQISIDENISAYIVFTDAELAEIAQLPELSPAKLKTIKGIGDKKAENYGQRMIKMYKEAIKKTTENETEGKSDTPNNLF